MGKYCFYVQYHKPHARKTFGHVETSVISHLTARDSADPILFGHQQLTQSWWAKASGNMQLCGSRMVIEEASRGDPNAAALRLAEVAKLHELPLTQAAIELSGQLLSAGALPPQAAVDALHVAMYDVIERVCAAHGFKAPRICTPVELWGM